MSLNGKVCLLTGATGGIGYSLAQCLAAQGAELILTGRSQSRLAKLQAALPSHVTSHTIAADLTQPDDLTRLAAHCAELQVSVLINLSGVNTFGLFEQQCASDLANIMALNALAPMQLTQQLLPALKSRPSATIINVGSAFGSIGHPGYSAYCASKFALRGFSEALGRELSDSSVKVLHISPRTTATSMNSSAALNLSNKLGNSVDTPQWVAKQITDAIKRQSNRRVLGWPEKLFAKLNQIAPGLVDRTMTRQLAVVKQLAGESLMTPQITTPQLDTRGIQP